MSNYRRSLTRGGTFFFTVVTYRRQDFLVNAEARHFLRDAIIEVRKTQPFTIDAFVLLPEHLHCIWTLPEGDKDFSKRWGRIKAIFSKKIKNGLYQPQWVKTNKQKRRESTIWQRRFWEHEIKNQQDFNHHMDYIHYNPVKHGLVSKVNDWPYSSFHLYVKKKVYPINWACKSNFDNNFGE